MTPSPLEWLPVGIGVAAALTGLLGLGLAFVPKLRTTKPALVANSARYLLAGTLLLLPVSRPVRGRFTPPEPPVAVAPLVETGLTSDPEGAEVYLDDVFVGTTPLTFQRSKGSVVAYRVQAGEAVPDATAYESYEGEIVVDEAVTVSVWLNRKPLEP